MTKLEVRDLTIDFGGLRALSCVNFSVEEGEIYTIIGPNGAGKTTIFNCINRIYTPDSGSIRFEGQELLNKKISEISKIGEQEKDSGFRTH